MGKNYKRVTIQVSAENYARFKGLSEDIGIPLTRLFDKILGNITTEQIKDIIFTPTPKVEVKLSTPVQPTQKSREKEPPAEELKVSIKDINDVSKNRNSNTDDDKPSNFKLKL